MKSFRFRMQAVLNQRERKEKEAYRNFAEAEAAHQRALQLLAELHEVRQALNDELRSRQTDQFDAMETRLYQEYMQTIAQSIREHELHIRHLAAIRDSMKDNVISATQDRRMMDTVRDRHRDDFLRAQERAMQNQIDELASTRHVHLNRPGE